MNTIKFGVMSNREFFEITAVSRDDLKAAGFMADAYIESSFWTDLEIIAEELGIKREE